MIYSLTQVEEYIPPVQRSAVVGLVNNFWSVRSQGIANEVVRGSKQFYLFVVTQRCGAYTKILYEMSKPLVVTTDEGQ